MFIFQLLKKSKPREYIDDEKTSSFEILSNSPLGFHPSTGTTYAELLRVIKYYKGYAVHSKHQLVQVLYPTCGISGLK